MTRREVRQVSELPDPELPASPRPVGELPYPVGDELDRIAFHNMLEYRRRSDLLQGPAKQVHRGEPHPCDVDGPRA